MTGTKTKKDEIFEKAQDEFGTKLDRRLTLSQLEDQMKSLARDKKNPPKEIEKLIPKTVKNVITGNVFDYNPLFKGNPDLQVIEWENTDGNN
jgi:hypothetical protein